MINNEDNFKWAVKKLSAFNVFNEPFSGTEGYMAYVEGFLRLVRNEPCKELDGANDADWIIAKMIDQCTRFPMIAEMREAYRDHGVLPWDKLQQYNKEWHQGKYAKSDPRSEKPPEVQ
jgi:hypothetical protein